MLRGLVASSAMIDWLEEVADRVPIAVMRLTGFARETFEAARYGRQRFRYHDACTSSG